MMYQVYVKQALDGERKQLAEFSDVRDAHMFAEMKLLSVKSGGFVRVTNYDVEISTTIKR